MPLFIWSRPVSIPMAWPMTHQSNFVPQFLSHDGCIHVDSHCTSDWLPNWQEMQGWDRTRAIESMSKWRKCHKSETTNLQNIQTDLAIIVNVGMKHFGEETDLRCLVGVIFREFKDQFEGASLPRRIVRAKNDRLPEHNVRVHGSACYSRRRVILKSNIVIESNGQRVNRSTWREWFHSNECEWVTRQVCIRVCSQELGSFKFQSTTATTGSIPIPIQ